MDKDKVGNRIKEFMKEKGLTQQMIADQFGLSQSNISEMTSGKRNTLKLAELIADNYDVSLDYLIYGVDNISEQDINISNTDIPNGESKYAAKLLSLLNEYLKNERVIQDNAARNKEILKQMVEIDKIMKGE